MSVLLPLSSTSSIHEVPHDGALLLLGVLDLGALLVGPSATVLQALAPPPPVRVRSLRRRRP
jgi:hypothetical protein